MQERFGIAAFRSRQQVLRLEAALGCGLSVRFEMQDAPRVLSAVNRLRPQNMIGVYDVEKTGGRAKLTVLRQ